MNQQKKRSISRKEKRNAFEAVKRALENPNYKFRTLAGVSAEAHMSVEAVERVMREHADEVVFLFRKGQNGESLITTRDHYKKKASLKDKIMGAVINRVY